MIISSGKNEIYKKLLSLTSSKGIRENQQALLAGATMATEFAQNNPTSSFFWIMHPTQSLPAGEWHRTVTLEKSLFESIDISGSRHPLLCITTPEFSPMDQLDADKPALYSGMGDPTNLGAVLRSAKAFGVSQIVLLEESAHPFLPRALRAAAGYGLDFQFFKGPSIKNLNLPNLSALHMEGESTHECKMPSNLHLLVGQEGQGVPTTFCGQRLSIPMKGSVESLNASVAVGILLYEWDRQTQSGGDS